MKTPLGTEVDLGPGHTVLDGTKLPRERGTAATFFSAHVYCGHGRPFQLLLSSCTDFQNGTVRHLGSACLGLATKIMCCFLSLRKIWFKSILQFRKHTSSNIFTFDGKCLSSVILARFEVNGEKLIPRKWPQRKKPPKHVFWRIKREVMLRGVLWVRSSKEKLERW